MMFINTITTNPRFHHEGIKQCGSMVGMIFVVYLQLKISASICNFPPRFSVDSTDQAGLAVYTWLIVELYVFFGIILSNISFLALRTCFRHKIHVDNVPERK